MKSIECWCGQHWCIIFDDLALELLKTAFRIRLDHLELVLIGMVFWWL